MPFGLGFFATTGGGAAGGGAFDLLETQVLGSDTASITFSSLSTYAADYKHLQIRYTTRATSSGTTNNMGLRFNGVSSASYSHHRLYGNGSSVASYSTGALNTLMLVDGVPGASAPSNTFTGGVIDILDPYITTKNTTVRTLCGFTAGGDNVIELTSGAYYNTEAVSSATILPLSGSLAQYSRFSLYGIKGA